MGHSMISLRWVVLVGLSAILFGGCGGSGADERANEPAPLKAADAAHARKLQELLDVQRDGYGATAMAAAIIVRSRLVWSGGSGVANRETKAPVTADTPFPIFSITKMFVGAGGQARAGGPAEARRSAQQDAAGVAGRRPHHAAHAAQPDERGRWRSAPHRT